MIAYIHYLEISCRHCHDIPTALKYFRSGNKKANRVYNLITFKVEV